MRNVRAKEGNKTKRVAKILPYASAKRADSLREYEMLKVGQKGWFSAKHSRLLLCVREHRIGSLVTH